MAFDSTELPEPGKNKAISRRYKERTWSDHPAQQDVLQEYTQGALQYAQLSRSRGPATLTPSIALVLFLLLVFSIPTLCLPEPLPTLLVTRVV
jgi:hypothetical protein